jgi:hypothetical protein
MSGMFGENIERPKYKSVEWYTPSWVFSTLGLTFDLDPASPHDMETMVPACTKYTLFDIAYVVIACIGGGDVSACLLLVLMLRAW